MGLSEKQTTAWSTSAPAGQEFLPRQYSWFESVLKAVYVCFGLIIPMYVVHSLQRLVKLKLKT